MKMGREYASALFTLAVEEGKQKEYFASLETVKTVLVENGEYMDFLNSFSIPKSEICVVLSHSVSIIPGKFTIFINYFRVKLKFFRFYACYPGNNSI